MFRIALTRSRRLCMIVPLSHQLWPHLNRRRLRPGRRNRSSRCTRDARIPAGADRSETEDWSSIFPRFLSSTAPVWRSYRRDAKPRTRRRAFHARGSAGGGPPHFGKRAPGPIFPPVSDRGRGPLRSLTGYGRNVPDSTHDRGVPAVDEAIGVHIGAEVCGVGGLTGAIAGLRRVAGVDKTIAVGVTDRAHPSAR